MRRVLTCELFRLSPWQRGEEGGEGIEATHG